MSKTFLILGVLLLNGCAAQPLCERPALTIIDDFRGVMFTDDTARDLFEYIHCLEGYKYESGF